MPIKRTSFQMKYYVNNHQPLSESDTIYYKGFRNIFIFGENYNSHIKYLSKQYL